MQSKCVSATAAILACFLFAGNRTACAGQTNVDLIIDDSGSMAQRIEGQSKIAIAKQVLSEMIQSLPSDAQIAVRTYGRQKPSNQRDCSDMEVITPFGPNTASRVLPGVQALKPNGMTPIAASLEAAGANDFAGKEGQNNIIVLLSDGEEDCNGDPCIAAKLLHQSNIHLQVNVIGFHVQPKERTQLQCVANAGGGKYYDAENAKELKVAASEVKESIAASPLPPAATPTAATPTVATPTSSPTPYVKQGEPLYGEAIKGGDSYEQAVALQAGKLYHLNHEQPPHMSDFFTVQTRGGQTIQVSVVAGPSHGSIGASIISPKRENLSVSVDIDGPRRNDMIHYEVADQQDGAYYVLIGSGYGTVEADDTFRVDLINNYDANSDRDAGSDETRALEVSPGTYLHNYMGGTDTADVFKFKLEGGKTYQFKARPSSEKATIQAKATDSDGAILAEGSSPNRGAAVKLENLKLDKSGSIYIKVTYDQYGDKGPYSFAFGEGQVDSPPPPPAQ